MTLNEQRLWTAIVISLIIIYFLSGCTEVPVKIVHIPNYKINEVASVSCPKTKLIGFTAPLTLQEKESLNHASKRCVELYSNLPCLKSFEKRAEQVFWAICGEEK